MTIEEILVAGKDQGDRFSRWLKFVLSWECVFEADGLSIRTENVPGDSGGRTIAGIDEASHPHFDFESPTPKAIVDCYLADGWKQYSSLNFPICEVCSNFSVNLGFGASIRLLQEGIEAQTTISLDGKLGPYTLSTANKIDAHRLAEDIESAADSRYRRIAIANPRDRKFLAGWLARDAALDHWWKSLS